MQIKISLSLLSFLITLSACTHQKPPNKTTQSIIKKVKLTHGIDESAGGCLAYIITTPTATYYLEKEGGGLSSMIDKDGVDWIAFHNKPGSAHKGEYRGFPNAIHKQDGSYFHAMNAKTDPSISFIKKETANHVRIVFTSDNQKWKGQWDFYTDRCYFSMIKVSPSYKYWVQYEGVPGGEMDSSDFWYASADTLRHPITEPFLGDLPAPEWMAFGDANSPRVLYMLHHQDDEFPDNYVSRSDMTVFGFGRENKNKFLTRGQIFSIGFLESTEYYFIAKNLQKNLTSGLRY